MENAQPIRRFLIESFLDYQSVVQATENLEFRAFDAPYGASFMRSYDVPSPGHFVFQPNMGKYYFPYHDLLSKFHRLDSLLQSKYERNALLWAIDNFMPDIPLKKEMLAYAGHQIISQLNTLQLTRAYENYQALLANPDNPKLSGEQTFFSIHPKSRLYKRLHDSFYQLSYSVKSQFRDINDYGISTTIQDPVLRIAMLKSCIQGDVFAQKRPHEFAHASDRIPTISSYEFHDSSDVIRTGSPSSSLAKNQKALLSEINPVALAALQLFTFSTVIHTSQVREILPNASSGSNFTIYSNEPLDRPYLDALGALGYDLRNYNYTRFSSEAGPIEALEGVFLTHTVRANRNGESSAIQFALKSERDFEYLGQCARNAMRATNVEDFYTHANLALDKIIQCRSFIQVNALDDYLDQLGTTSKSHPTAHSDLIRMKIDFGTAFRFLDGSRRLAPRNIEPGAAQKKPLPR